MARQNSPEMGSVLSVVSIVWIDIRILRMADVCSTWPFLAQMDIVHILLKYCLRYGVGL